jgi:hypothetical protein
MISMGVLVAAAGVDPYALHRTLADGRPDAIFTLAKAFGDAGSDGEHAPTGRRSGRTGRWAPPSPTT